MELSVQLPSKDFRTSVGQSTDLGEDSRLTVQNEGFQQFQSTPATREAS